MLQYICQFGLILCLILAAINSFATEVDVVNYDTIVVTATRSERATLDVPAAVSAVTEETIADLPLLGPKEALSGLAGVQSETRNGGYDTRLIIRGAGLKARYGVREIMVLLDGVPITDPDGMTRLDFVDTQMIRQIDVVRGPNSTLYGANATGGVINIITRDPFEEYKSLTAGVGSDNTLLTSLLYGTSVGNSFLSLSASHKETDGWREWNSFKSDQGSLKVGQLLADGSTLTATLSYTEADIHLPGTLSRDEFNADPAQLTSEPFRHNGRYSKIFSTALRWEKPWGEWNFTPLFYLQDWEHFHPVPGTINDGGATVIGVDLQGNYQHQLFGLPAELTMGLSTQLDDGDNRKDTYRDLVLAMSGAVDHTLSDAPGDLAELSSDRVTKSGLYMQESFQPLPQWTVDLGLRYDYVSFDLDATVFREFIWGANRYKDLVTPQDISTRQDFSQLSPRFGVNWRLSEQMSVYGNISTGFQTPQASELNENSSLDSSLTVNYELGMKGRHQGGHRFDLALFYQTVDDEIVQTILEGNQTSYSNAGQTTKYGIELAGEVVLPYGLKTGGSYTYSDFSFETFTEPVYRYNPMLGATELVLMNRSGNQLPYIPRHQFNWFAAYQHQNGFKARFETATWGEYWIDNANSEKYGGYDLVSRLMLGWENEHWDLVFNVNNLFDEKYAMEVTKSGDELRFRPGAPRTLFAKLTYRF